jgi:DNA-binding MarR family transcriptional regulator
MTTPGRKITVGDCMRVRDTCLGLNLRSAERLIAQIYDLEMRPHGIKGTQFTLMVAIHAMQPVIISRLADQLRLDRTTLSRNLELLGKSAWIDIQSHGDRRERHVSLTERGEGAIADAFAAWERAQRKVHALGGERAVTNLVSELKKLAEKVA